MQAERSPADAAARSGSLLEAHHLLKRFKKRTVVRDVSMSVRAGEIVGLLGPNGAGKTTSFYMMVGLIAADGGRIELDGEDITHLPMHTRARRGLGYLPQEASVFRKLSTADNIRAVLEVRKDLDAAGRKDELERLLQEFRIEHIRDGLGQSLSGGERRRVEIARALAANPRFILLDEPFAGVDPIAVKDIHSIITQLQRHGIGVLVTDHNVREMLGICSRAYILAEGEVIAEGDPATIERDERVRRVYLGEDFRL
ncbi:LPS export ABC transporter ATP-binding protein [Algiphilus sp. W345]|uniref:Lipopolysaccharide export system ATP-binding protein LptB n=1 Tax=Banduia mediterranea TaxID=3075609 RepID=A0ABU2WKJ4_9GAMM|nr:LPS export ABC transporter ATP-binding protein [Algiphilus sp. W345]MDT0498397.1 LPS export ABC transporter ATP-binding protein [Algiphilus sp. W345]